MSSLGSTTRTVPGQNMTRPPPHPLSEHGGEGKIEVKTKMEVGKMEVKIEVKMAVKMEVKMGARAGHEPTCVSNGASAHRRGPSDFEPLCALPSG